MVKNPPTNARDVGSIPGLGRYPSPVFLPGKAHGQRSLVGYSPWDHKRVRHDFTSKQLGLLLPIELYHPREETGRYSRRTGLVSLLVNTNPSREVSTDTTRKLWGKLVNAHCYTLSHCMNVPNSKMVHGATLHLILFPNSLFSLSSPFGHLH